MRLAGKEWDARPYSQLDAWGKKFLPIALERGKEIIRVCDIMAETYLVRYADIRSEYSDIRGEFDEFFEKNIEDVYYLLFKTDRSAIVAAIAHLEHLNEERLAARRRIRIVLGTALGITIAVIAGSYSYARLSAGRTSSKSTEHASTQNADICKKVSTENCYNLGKAAVEEGKKDGRKNSEARQIYSTACARNHPTACSALGFLLLAGLGGEADISSGARFIRRACELQPTTACHDAIRDLLDEKPLRIALTREIAERACELNSMQACVVAGVLYFMEPKRDFTQARAKAGIACSKGIGTGCLVEAMAIGAANKAATKKQLEPILLLLDKACRLKTACGCIMASYLRHASGSKTETSALDRDVKPFCNSGVRAGCFALERRQQDMVFQCLWDAARNPG